VAGQLGGTGVALDWLGLRDAVWALRAAVPDLQLIVAGGLRPATVGDAVRLLSPECVDVSSGVEQAPGVKDPVRVRAFVDAVRATAG
jgi:phosphoribosylanthranilate isomerase